MTAYLSHLASKSIISSLNDRGIRTVALPPFSALSSPVDSHSDMLLLAVGDTVFVHEDYELSQNGQLARDFQRIVKVCEPISARYPNDVLLNISVIGDLVIANTEFASRTALEHLRALGKTVVSVKQGYAHCSVCAVGNNALISADAGIVNAARQNGLDALEITEGHISLPPYEYGFIGGASGSDEENVYFCGSLDYHPDGERIREFCLSHGVSPIELCNSP